MCGRYVLHDTESIRQRFGITNKFELRSSYNIAPGSIQPVVVRNSPNSLELMRWGLVPFWAKEGKLANGLINARFEGIEKKPAFRKAIREQRCLIPANGFYEWGQVKLEKKEEKYPFYFETAQGALFAFAGIYDLPKENPDKKHKTFAILTMAANHTVKPVHPRMPVILNRQTESDWLDPKTDIGKILQIIQQSADLVLHKHIVSKAVNNPGNDSIENINPLQE